MTLDYTRSGDTYDSRISKLHYHIYRNNNNTSGQKLLMLHGIRLGGVETWEPIIRKLERYSEILVPDLLGAGCLNKFNKTDQDFTAEILVESLIGLLAKHEWASFDLAGYSFGGFLSMLLAQHLKSAVSTHFLIESALLAQTAENLPEIGNRLNAIAELVKSDSELGNKLFSELVSQKNVRKFALTSNVRPIHNPLGFVNLLRIMVDFYFFGDLWSLIDVQHSVVSVLAEPMSEGKINLFKQIKLRYPDWTLISIPNSDHSLVFTHPDELAQLINRESRG